MTNLGGRRVLVTGASRGIGKEIANAFAAAGAELALVARSRDALEKVASEVGGLAYPADLTEADDVEGLIARVEADGPLDVLVNNAALLESGFFTELPPAGMRSVVLANLVAPIVLCRQVAPGMVRRGGGHIVNVSSLGGCNTVPGVTPYSASKAGLSHFTGLLRAEVKGLPIRTTLVEIGPVRTEMIDDLRAHPVAARALRRLERMRLAVELDPELVAAKIVGAVQRDRRHVRLPARAAAFAMMAEAPRRMSEWLLAGIDHQKR